MGPLRRGGNAISSSAPAPEVEPDEKPERLAAGSACRVYRDGGSLTAQLTVPRDPDAAMLVRSLAPGRYVARDEQGGEVAFEVSAGAEFAVVQGEVGEFAGGVYGEVSTPAEKREDEVQADAIVPPLPDVAQVDVEIVGDDAARVEGAAGSSAVNDDPAAALPVFTEQELAERDAAVAALDEQE